MKKIIATSLVLLFSISASIATAGGWETLVYTSPINEDKIQSVTNAMKMCEQLGTVGSMIQIEYVFPSSQSADKTKARELIHQIKVECGIH